MKLKRAIAATFDNKDQARMTLNKIGELGVEDKDVGVLMSHRGAEHAESESRLAQVLARGTFISGAMGAFLGGFVTVASTITLAEGVVFFSPAYFFAALAGIGIGSTVGGLSGWYAGMGFEEEIGTQEEGGMIKEGIFIVVTVDEPKAQRVKSIYQEEGGKYISIARTLEHDAPLVQNVRI